MRSGVFFYILSGSKVWFSKVQLGFSWITLYVSKFYRRCDFFTHIELVIFNSLYYAEKAITFRFCWLSKNLISYAVIDFCDTILLHDIKDKLPFCVIFLWMMGKIPYKLTMLSHHFLVKMTSITIFSENWFKSREICFLRCVTNARAHKACALPVCNKQSCFLVALKLGDNINFWELWKSQIGKL